LVKSFLYAQPGFIFTVAGNGTMGYTGDHGLADSAQLDFPSAVAVDSVGNIYFCDRDNHVIRKVDTNQIITTFAGNGYPGSEGDGGLAIDAEFSAPYGITLDKAGNIYIADEYMRKIDISTGIITNFAGGGTNNPGDGGAASEALTESIGQIAFDGIGNLYITDGRHASIRKVDTSGIITTVAGSDTMGCSGDGGPATSAELNMPRGVAIDTGGNIFIADFQNHNIRRVDAQTGLISTISGDPFGNDGGYSGDNGPASRAVLMTPNQLAFDAGGDLFIDDPQNQSVRVINTLGIIFTIAGQNQSNGMPPDSLTDADGIPATDATLRSPYEIAIDQQNNLYIAEADNFKVRKVDFGGTAGIQSTAGTISFHTYPNPASELLYVESASLGEGKISYAVYNVAGQLVSLPYTLAANQVQFNTSKLAPGMYYIHVVSDAGNGTARFVKE
jgi:sugar lactone lactonase YvrE